MERKPQASSHTPQAPDNRLTTKTQRHKEELSVESLSGGRKWRREGEVQWCPGCGNFGILDALAGALDALKLEPWQVCIVSGIGQAGKLAHYLRCNFMHGLHGRTLAHACGVKLANPELTVIAVGGGGDIYGEGGGHLVHAFRRNLDIACLVHNNGVYGLTKGQPSPTASTGFKSRTSPEGLLAPGLNPIALGIAAEGTFVSRGFAGNKEHLAGLIVQAVKHKGFGFVDILQPCVTYNKVNTFQWYEQRLTDLEETGHDRKNRESAFARALEWPDQLGEGRSQKSETRNQKSETGNQESEAEGHEVGGAKIPIGVFFQEQRKTYEEHVPALARGPLFGPQPDPGLLKQVLEGFR